MMEDTLLRELWEKEAHRAFQGWNFEAIRDRWDGGIKTPWEYDSLVRQYLKPADTLLDMGTGGGEFLLNLHHPYALTTVTEAYPPNIELCRKKLEPLGITVKAIQEDQHLPLQNRYFDCVINRHESFDPKEVTRINKNGGIFITQQVGGRNDWDLADKVCGSHQEAMKDWDLDHVVKTLEPNYEILFAQACEGTVSFFDVGALVYFATQCPWEFVGFSVERDFQRLKQIEQEIQATGSVTGSEQRFVIVAKRNMD